MSANTEANGHADNARDHSDVTSHQSPGIWSRLTLSAVCSSSATVIVCVVAFLTNCQWGPLLSGVVIYSVAMPFVVMLMGALPYSPGIYWKAAKVSLLWVVCCAVIAPFLDFALETGLAQVFGPNDSLRMGGSALIAGMIYGLTIFGHEMIKDQLAKSLA